MKAPYAHSDQSESCKCAQQESPRVPFRSQAEIAKCASTIDTKSESTPFASLFDNTTRNLARHEHDATGVPDRDSGPNLRWWRPYRNFGPTSLNSVRPSTSGHALPSVLSTLRPSDTAPTTAARALTLFVVDMASTQPQGCVHYAVAVQRGSCAYQPQRPAQHRTDY